MIPAGSSLTDLKGAFGNVKCGIKANIEYEWVESRQDRLKSWFQLTIEQLFLCLFCLGCVIDIICNVRPYETISSKNYRSPSRKR